MAKKRIPRYKRDADGEATPRPRSGRIAADPSKRAPNNSYGPPLFYEDRPFESGEARRVAVREFQSPRTRAEVMATIEEFAAAILAFLARASASS
ncbi:MAG TPA: hypothetical protein VNH11_31575 [Pirellulales bacterium]|nr:hypothetical protein [Pirellulales bacterium]